MSKSGSSTRAVTWPRWFSVIWLLGLVAIALLADILPLPRFPDLLSSDVPPLSPGHFLGTDLQGRDVLNGLVYGARTALLVSLPTTLLATTLGTMLGVAAGYWGNTEIRLPLAWVLAIGSAGIIYSLVTVAASSLLAGWWLATLCGTGLLAGVGLMRFRSLQQSIVMPINTLVSTAIVLLAALPRLLLVVVVASATEPNMVTLVGLLTLTFWPQSAQLVRAEVRRVRQLPYLEAARSLGLPTSNIIFRHVLPNSWRVVRTSLPMSLAVLISLETTLSFLGVGLPPEVSSWGRLLAASRLAPSSWWLTVFPASALLLTALALRQLLPTANIKRKQ